MNQKNSKFSTTALIGIFVTVPFVLALPPIIGWYLGRWIDSTFNFSLPVFEYLLTGLGIIAGFREFYRMIKKFGDLS